jgi:D-inositol-3-phosphate glycosyltransferase
MKIAVIDPIGKKMGMNHYDNGLMNALSRKGLSAFILSNYKSPFENVYSHLFFNISNNRLQSAWYNFFGMIRSILFCKGEKMDWIIYHIFRGGLFDLFALSFAKMCGLKILFIVHDIETIDTVTYKNIKRMVLRHFHNAMVVHNHFSLEKLKVFTGNDTDKNTYVIPHGNYTQINKQNFSREGALHYFQFDPSQNYLLFFGQIKKTKGLDVLLEAMHYTKSNYKLIIAGKLRINSFNSYQKIIEQYDLQKKVITFLKFIPDDETDKLLSLCDAVVLPYRNIYQSGVLMLAMSFGKTVIASDLEPFREIIKNGVNGLLFERSNPKSLAEIIDNFFAAGYNIKKIEQQAQQTAEKLFSWNEIGEKFAGILN